MNKLDRCPIFTSLQEVQDIFLDMRDNSELVVKNVWNGNSFSFSDEIIKRKDLDTISEVKVIPSLIIRFHFKNDSFQDLNFSDDFFIDIKNGIGHIESQYNLELNSIYLSTLKSGLDTWFKSIESIQSKSIKELVYMDISFKLKL